MPKTSEKKRAATPKKKTAKSLIPGYQLQFNRKSDARFDLQSHSDAELQKSITYGLRKIAATQKRSRRTQEEIVRLRKESRALLEKL
jgi:hypothetical protein